jgi:hypothetical protein
MIFNPARGNCKHPCSPFRQAAANADNAHRPWMGVYLLQSSQGTEGAEEELMIDADGIAWGNRRSRPGKRMLTLARVCPHVYRQLVLTQKTTHPHTSMRMHSAFFVIDRGLTCS